MERNGTSKGRGVTRQRGAVRDLFDADTASTPRLAVSALTPVQTRLLEASHNVQHESQRDVLYQHSLLCQTGLPTKQPGEGIRFWERRQGRAHVMLEAGHAYHPGKGRAMELPLPYGPKARLVMIHVHSQAVRTQSPVVDVGDSMTSFVRRVMSGPEKQRDPNGREIRAFKDQLAALAAARMSFAFLADGRATQVNAQIIRSFDVWFPKDASQRVFWPSTVELSPEYFENLARHAVPLHDRAISALSHSAVALDAYCWLSQRLHWITPGKPQLVPWVSLYEQFGQGYSQLRQFRAFFLKMLRQVHTVYPEARFDIDRRGMLLHQSQPPISRRLIVVNSPAVVG